ncbi:MAG: thioredoxin family protein [Phycisphaerales bacterium]
MAKAMNFMLALLVVTLIAWLAMCSRSCGAPAYPEGFERGLTLQEAAARADDSGRPVLVLVVADWSQECGRLRAGALDSARVVEWIAANTEPVCLDVSAARTGNLEAQAAMVRLGVSELPAIVLLRRGREIGRLDAELLKGEIGSRALVQALGQALAAADAPADEGPGDPPG